MSDKYIREDNQFFTQNYPILSKGIATDDLDLVMGDIVSYNPTTEKCTRLSGTDEPYGIVYISKPGIEATVVIAGSIIKDMIKFDTGADEEKLTNKLRTLGIHLS